MFMYPKKLITKIYSCEDHLLLLRKSVGYASGSGFEHTGNDAGKFKVVSS